MRASEGVYFTATSTITNKA